MSFSDSREIFMLKLESGQVELAGQLKKSGDRDKSNDSNSIIYELHNVQFSSSAFPSVTVNLGIANAKIKMEVDSGASRTIMTEEIKLKSVRNL